MADLLGFLDALPRFSHYFPTGRGEKGRRLREIFRSAGAGEFFHRPKGAEKGKYRKRIGFFGKNRLEYSGKCGMITMKDYAPGVIDPVGGCDSTPLHKGAVGARKPPLCKGRWAGDSLLGGVDTIKDDLLVKRA